MLRSSANAAQVAESRTTSPVAKLMPKNGWTMYVDPRTSASSSEAFHAAASNGCGIETCPELTQMSLASVTSLNSSTVLPTNPACSTRW